VTISVTVLETSVAVTGTAGPIVNVAVTEVASPVLVTALVQGPAGPVGPAGVPGIIGVAGEDLSGHRVVKVNGAGAYIYCQDIYGIGLTLGAATSGNPVSVQTVGEVEEPSWAWTPGLPVYQTGMGLLTQVLPTSGFIREIGIALAPTKISLTFQSPIALG